MVLKGLHLIFLCAAAFVTPSFSNVFDWMPAPTSCKSDHAASTDPGVHPDMPRLPGAYSASVIATMANGGWSYNVEENVDNSTGMASILVAASGESHNAIFSSDPLERYIIQDEDTCTVEKAGVDFHPLAFASMDQTTLTPSKISFRLLFQSAIDSGSLAYVGQTRIRGIKVDHWTLCQEWTDKSAKIQTDFYVSVPGYKSSSNQEEIPIRVEMKGTTGLFNTDHITSSFTFENIYDFGSPENVDEGVFEVPMGVVCTGRSSNKALPELPDIFEMDVELNAPYIGTSLPLQTSLRFDWQNQLLESVREFALPQGLPGDKSRFKPASHFQDQTVKNQQGQSDWIVVQRVSWVEDYHTGIQYITVKNNNTCSVHHTPSTNNTMSHGNMLLTMYNDKKSGLSQLTYQGRSTVRGMPVESWGMDKDGVVQKFFFLAKTKGAVGTNVDTSNMTAEDKTEFDSGVMKLQMSPLNKFPALVAMVVRNRKAVNSKNFPMLIKDLIRDGIFSWENGKLKLTTNRNVSTASYEDALLRYVAWSRRHEMQTEHIGELDVFVQHFRPVLLKSDMFHISQCYKPEEISKVILTVKTSFEENVRLNPTSFLYPLRSSVAKAIGVSVIVISDIQATPVVNKEKGIDYTLVTFNLLGATPMKENNIEQQALATSKRMLNTAIKNGITFSVRYIHDTKSFSVDNQHFAMDFDLEEFPLVKDASSKNYGNNQNAPRMKGNDDDDDGGRFSGGEVAGIAIAVAIATALLTALIIVGYIKTRKPNFSSSIPYVVAKE